MKSWVVALRFIGVGWYVAFCVLLGLLGGSWLDDKLNTSPIMVIIGILVGLIFTFIGLKQMILPLIESNRNNKEND